jgi:hypothetical protein
MMGDERDWFGRLIAHGSRSSSSWIPQQAIDERSGASPRSVRAGSLVTSLVIIGF